MDPPPHPASARLPGFSAALSDCVYAALAAGSPSNWNPTIIYNVLAFWREHWKTTLPCERRTDRRLYSRICVFVYLWRQLNCPQSIIWSSEWIKCRFPQLKCKFNTNRALSSINTLLSILFKVLAGLWQLPSSDSKQTLSIYVDCMHGQRHLKVLWPFEWPALHLSTSLTLSLSLSQL